MACPPFMILLRAPLLLDPSLRKLFGISHNTQIDLLAFCWHQTNFKAGW